MQTDLTPGVGLDQPGRSVEFASILKKKQTIKSTALIEYIDLMDYTDLVYSMDLTDY